MALTYEVDLELAKLAVKYAARNGHLPRYMMNVADLEKEADIFRRAVMWVLEEYGMQGLRKFAEGREV